MSAFSIQIPPFSLRRGRFVSLIVPLPPPPVIRWAREVHTESKTPASSLRGFRLHLSGGPLARLGWSTSVSDLDPLHFLSFLQLTLELLRFLS